MPIDGVPPIAIAEPVDVRLEHVTIHVDVGDEEGEVACTAPSVPPLPEYAKQLYFIWDLEVRKRIAPTDLFFIVKKETTLLQAVADKILGIAPQQS
jgi:hypothetical protein